MDGATCEVVCDIVGSVVVEAVGGEGGIDMYPSDIISHFGEFVVAVVVEFVGEAFDGVSLNEVNMSEGVE